MFYKYISYDDGLVYDIQDLDEDDIVRLYIEDTYKKQNPKNIAMEKAKYIRFCKKEKIEQDMDLIQDFYKRMLALNDSYRIKKGDIHYNKIIKEMIDNESLLYYAHKSNTKIKIELGE